MNVSTFTVLASALYDLGPYGRRFYIKGPNAEELADLLDHDYDEVDGIYIDHETIGG